MKYSIVIPTYNDWDRLEICLKQLQKTKKISDFEIIVVDNAAEHKLPQVIKSYSKLKIVHEATPGSYAARNKGAGVASGEILAFTDSDCVPDLNWLANAENLFLTTNCDLIGGRIDLFKPENGGDWAFLYDTYTAFRQESHVPKGRSVTANLFVKKKVFEELGGFDSTVKSGGDWEFTERAVSKGFVMAYGEDVIVQHPSRKSIRDILKKQKRFAAWGYLNVKNKYGHSSLRILGSNLLRGTPAAFKRGRLPARWNEKLIVLFFSLQIHFYKLLLQFLFLLKVLNPEKIRE